MKVVEKGTDRTAKVNFHVQEQVHECFEYGQHVDPTDGALCCYVAVNEGDVIKITGRFYGTTLTAAYDLFVDGVLRKSNNCVSKVVKYQKGFRLDVDAALVHVDNGDTKILDTQMMVVPISDLDICKGEGPETVGTIELRLYVLRTFGTECPLDRTVATYLNETETEAESGEDGKDKTHDESEKTQEKDSESKQEKRKVATYKSIAPDFMIDFEKNCQEIDRKKANAEKKKLTSKRPDKEPWAIFRFYYRSKETILKNKLDITYNPKAKGKHKGEEPYSLELEPVPELSIGAKPVKAEDGGSTRATSSPPFEETTLTSGNQSHRSHSPLAYIRPYVEDASPEGTVNEDLTNKPAVEPKPEPRLEQAAAQHTPDTNPAESSLAVTKAGNTKATNLIESTPAIPIPPPAPIKPLAPPVPTTTPTTTTLKRPAASTPNPDTNAKRPRHPPVTTATTLAETRRQLAIIKTRRTQAAKKRAELDAQLEPYSAQVRAEQERLQRELDEETRAWKEEMVGLREDAAMLAELKGREERGMEEQSG